VAELYLGAILDKLRKIPDLKITALVRKEEFVDAIRKLGVEVVRGDLDVVTKHARAADITVNAANSDDEQLTNAILAGQKARVKEDGKQPAVLLHTSGVAVFAGESKDGRHDPGLKLWNVRSLTLAPSHFGRRGVLILPMQDGNEGDIRAIKRGMLHGQIDKLYALRGLRCPRSRTEYPCQDSTRLGRA